MGQGAKRDENAEKVDISLEKSSSGGREERNGAATQQWTKKTTQAAKPLKMKRGRDVGQKSMADLYRRRAKKTGAKAGNILHLVNTAAAAWLLQSCLILPDLMDCGLPGSSVHGILQTRVLKWVAMPSLHGDLPHPGIEPSSPALQADSLPLGHQGSPC